MILVAAALALEPEVGVHALAGLANTEAPIPLLFGGGATASIDPLRRLHLELSVDAGVTTEVTPWLGAAPRLRLFAGAPERPVLSAFVGPGLGVGKRGPQFLIEGGFSVDLLRSNGPRPRITALYAWEVSSASRVLITAGAVFGRKTPPVIEPEPIPVPAPVPVPVPEPVAEVPLDLDGDHMFWLPGPVCQWLPGDAAKAEIEKHGMQLTKLTAISPRGMREPSQDPNRQEIPEGPHTGRIAVTLPGPDLVFEGAETRAVEDGMAVFEHANGRADIRVVGGGRSAVYTVAVTEDSVSWVDATAPPSTRVLFGMGQSNLGPASQETIRTFLENLGGWSVRLSGSYSSEGSADKNRELAMARASAVRDALVAAGLPSTRVEVGPVQLSGTDLTSADARNATLQPVEAL